MAVVSLLGPNDLCVPHYYRMHRHGTTDKPKKRREILAESGMSYCPKCDQEKLYCEFNVDRQTHNGYAIYCKQCNLYKMESGKLKNLDRKLRNKYGISLQDYENMLEMQSGVCAICYSPPVDDKRLCVDHCHKTGRVRGLVHLECNIGLGAFRDSPEVLRSAARYLERDPDVIDFDHLLNAEIGKRTSQLLKQWLTAKLTDRA